MRRRDAPRARSRSVSPVRSVLSSRATSSSAYAASSTSCTATINRVERATSSARSLWASTVGSEVCTVAPFANTGSLPRAWEPLVAESRRSPMRSVVTVPKSAVASQAELPAATRSEARTDGWARSGP